MKHALKYLRKTLDSLSYPTNYFHFIIKALDSIPPTQQLGFINFFIAKIKQNIPPEYILNTAEFMGFNFHVNRCTHIPKPLTETLIENFLLQTKLSQHFFAPEYLFSPLYISKTALYLPRLYKEKGKLTFSLKQLVKRAKSITILDIGTGSGNIIISIANLIAPLYLKNHQVRLVATDTSRCALQIARKNAYTHKVHNYIHFLHAKPNSSSPIPQTALHSNVLFIITNPPYIPQRVYNKLPCDVKQQPSNSLIDNYLSLSIEKQAYKLVQTNRMPRIILYNEGVLFNLVS